MSCSTIVKKGTNCKITATKQFNGLDYCTRHYNVIIKKESEEKNDNDKSDNYENNNNNSQINLYEEYLKIKNTKDINKNSNDIIYNFENVDDIIKILNELNILFHGVEFIQPLEPEFINSDKNESGIYNYKILIDDNYYNMKIQDLQIKDRKNIIYYEYLILKELTDTKYIIQLCDACKPFYYKKNYYSILITEYLNESLKDRINNNIMSIDDIKEIAIQIIIIIQYIHNNKYLYLDLSPSNIMFVNKDSNKIKLINFRYCSKYLNHYSEFLDNVIVNKSIGNLLFSSININRSYSGIRIDDIESVLWILLYCLDSKLYNKIVKLWDTNSKPLIRLKEKIIKPSDSNINKNKCEYDFINIFINELRLYDNINNKKPNYSKFINIINNA